ncbi:peptidase S8/S53 domain-containing protein [Mycena olivaceomarginata]|nr:peptidase S8/S53 domain-containing protein [Mycena olivaceomarginata]
MCCYVERYLGWGSNGLPPQSAASLPGGGGLYYSNGRGFLDIALQAENVEIAWRTEAEINCPSSVGELWLVNGTSCASPILASMIVLINDRLISAGTPALGLLNPFLYTTGRAAFTDITSGTNPGCKHQRETKHSGFSASRGWDPVTGLGTPNFNLLLGALGI